MASEVRLDHFRHGSAVELVSEETVYFLSCVSSVCQAVPILDIENRNAANGEESPDLGKLCTEDLGKFRLVEFPGGLAASLQHGHL